MHLAQAIVLAIVQGITELFPISSVGHGVLVPTLAGWHINQSAPTFLPFLVMLHIGTAAALLVFFWRDWVRLLAAPLLDPEGQRPEIAQERRLMARLVLATLPAVAVGALLEKPLSHLYASVPLTAAFLMVNGLVLWIGEAWRQSQGGPRVELEQLRPGPAFLIGAVQALALIPGFSRSGVTLVGGLWAGLSHEAAARFAFLLATPIILAAGVKEIPKLLAGGVHHMLTISLVGGLVAGVCAYLAVAFLMRYFRRTEVDALRPFAIYCWAAGALALAWSTLAHVG